MKIRKTFEQRERLERASMRRMKIKQARFGSHETKMMNFREKIEKSEPLKFQKNHQDVDLNEIKKKYKWVTKMNIHPDEMTKYGKNDIIK